MKYQQKRCYDKFKHSFSVVAAVVVKKQSNKRQNKITVLKINRLFFQSSSKFTEKLSRKYTVPIYCLVLTPLHTIPISLTSYITVVYMLKLLKLNNNNNTLLLIKFHTLHQGFVVEFSGFCQMYNVMCPPLQYHSLMIRSRIVSPP